MHIYLKNFIPIHLEMTEPEGFLRASPQQEQQQDEQQE